MTDDVACDAHHLHTVFLYQGQNYLFGEVSDHGICAKIAHTFITAVSMIVQYAAAVKLEIEENLKEWVDALSLT